MLFVFLIVVIVTYIAIRAIIKIDREDDRRAARHRESEIGAKILQARRQENADRFEKMEFRVAGTSFREDALLSFGERSEDFEKSKRELVEEYDDGDRVYLYQFHCTKAELIPEPDNPHDADAIRVDFDGVTVGYIPRSDCKKAKELLDSGRIRSITPFIGGGPFKELALDPNFDGDEREPRFGDYEIIDDEQPIYARVTIRAIRPDAGGRHCPHCGAAAGDNAVFCINCGGKL